MAAVEVSPIPLPLSDLRKDAIQVEVTAASSLVSSPGDTGFGSDRLIVQSPYTDPEHLLDLDTLEVESALFARALSQLRNTRTDYATAPYPDSFNWDEVITEVRRLAAQDGGVSFKKTSFYVVAFRSQIKPETDYSHLGALDKPAHAEAIASGGFLRYWFGEPDDQLRNLATCLWRSRDEAIAGGRGPAHRKAAMSTRALYAYWKIDQHRLTIHDDAAGFDIEPWTE